MYQPTNWVDHVTTKRNIFKEIELDNGYVEHVPVEGEILQQGTPMDASRFNNMEMGIFGNNLKIMELLRLAQMFNRELQGLSGETGIITLTNSQVYPFNDSGLVVALQTPRDTTDYFVDTEIISNTRGFAGQIIITNKLLNGFRISYTGSAASIQIRYSVRGGVFR